MVDKFVRQKYLTAVDARLRVLEHRYPCAAVHKLIRHFDEEGAPRFYISYITAFKLVRQSEVGNYKPICRRNTARRMKDFYKAFCDFWADHQDLPDRQIIEHVIESPAPSYYVTPKIIDLVRRSR